MKNKCKIKEARIRKLVWFFFFYNKNIIVIKNDNNKILWVEEEATQWETFSKIFDKKWGEIRLHREEIWKRWKLNVIMWNCNCDFKL